MNLHQKLMKPFPVKAVSWRVGATMPDKSKGIALAYIDARDVMKRLDDVLGLGCWQCRYPFSGCCEIGVKIDDEWVWKSNGAGETQVEGEKGMYSDAFKRAAVMWGIGRYLYSLPNAWVPLVAKGKSHVIQNPPKLPEWATPEGYQMLIDEKATGQVTGEKIDLNKLDALVNEAILIVDECDDDEDAGTRRAKELYGPLTNDEQIYFNGKVQEKKYKNESTGRTCGYWGAFAAYLG
jgi:hypothetical protein